MTFSGHWFQGYDSPNSGFHTYNRVFPEVPTPLCVAVPGLERVRSSEERSWSKHALPSLPVVSRRPWCARPTVNINRAKHADRPPHYHPCQRVLAGHSDRKCVVQGKGRIRFGRRFAVYPAFPRSADAFAEQRTGSRAQQISGRSPGQVLAQLPQMADARAVRQALRPRRLRYRGHCCLASIPGAARGWRFLRPHQYRLLRKRCPDRAGAPYFHSFLPGQRRTVLLE